MEKEKIIYRFNIKDYNNQLEKVLAKKTFPETIKNLLLSMLYKIENSYSDYQKVKVNVKLKKEILQEIIDIIEKKCDDIEIVKSGTECGNNELSNRKISTYLDEETLLYKIIQLEKPKFKIEEKYKLIRPYLQDTLSEGYITNINEIIRDFDGWAWNISAKKINDYINNFLYQTIIILTGNSFLEKWRNGQEDSIKEFKEELNKYVTSEETMQILNLIFQISIIENVLSNNVEKQKLLEIQSKLQNQFDEINDKKMYLQKIANEKKKIGKEIKDIDSIMNDDIKLKTEFINKNQILNPSERIFSLSDFEELLQNQRTNLISNLEEYSNKMKPENYIKEKNNISQELNLLKDLDLDGSIEARQKEMIVKLINLSYCVLSKKVKNAQIKKEIIELLYIIRYYKFVPISEKDDIKSLEGQQSELQKLEKELITKSCNLKIFNIFNRNVKDNFMIVKEILNTKIIDLEKVYVEIIKQEDNVLIKIYDENNIEKIVQCNVSEEINVKYNKKIKLFS